MRFFSLLVLYAALLPDLYFWSTSCILCSNFYGTSREPKNIFQADKLVQTNVYHKYQTTLQTYN